MSTHQALASTQGSSEPLLPHQSLNESGTCTILFIHGAFGDSNGWDLVTAYIREYHLLLPDTPGHGRSAKIPFSIERAATDMARLIENKAVGGRAHIVGHSLGASIAIHLAIEHPRLVLSTFVSGYSDMPLSRAPFLPYFFWTMQRLENAVPRPIIRWLMDGADLRRTPAASLSLCADIARSDSFKVRPWPSRTLIIVAGKGGLVPSADNPEAARRLVKIGKQGNGQTAAYAHPAMRHPWNRQDPELWATTVLSWVEEKEVPRGFTPLD